VSDKKAYLVRIWDSMASSMGDWENECICLSLETAKAEQARLSKRGYKTNVCTMKLVSEDNQ
jgi:hypothetical protein